jgi:ABC-type branched-subunit amino acid transport system ATPase component
MLDELMAGLTSKEISEELEIIHLLRSEHKITVLLIEHVMRAVMQVCERIIVLDHGVRIAQGTPFQIASDPLVIKAYMGDRIKTENKPKETSSADQETEASKS